MALVFCIVKFDLRTIGFGTSLLKIVEQESRAKERAGNVNRQSKAYFVLTKTMQMPCLS